MASVALMEYFKKIRRKQTEASELLESWDVMYDSLVNSDRKVELLRIENEKYVEKLRDSQERYDSVESERAELCKDGLKIVKVLEDIRKFAEETQNESLLKFLRDGI